MAKKTFLADISFYVSLSVAAGGIFYYFRLPFVGLPAAVLMFSVFKRLGARVFFLLAAVAAFVYLYSGFRFHLLSTAARTPAERLESPLEQLRIKLSSNIKKTLPSPESAIAAGVIFGKQAGIPSYLKNQMASSGTTHIIALSGYNISILAKLLSLIFIVALGRKKSIYLVVGAIVLFILMVGAEASVVRAAIMGVMLVLSGRLGRIWNFRNSITSSAAVMILASPSVVTDVGFQLSFFSLLGLSIIGEPLSNLSESPLFKLFSETAGAQAAVIPILVHYFRSFSLFALAANVIVLPAVPFVMLTSFFMAILSLIHAGLAFLLYVPSMMLLKWMMFFIALFSRIRLDLALPNSLGVYALYYLALIFVARFLRKKIMNQ